MAQRVRALALLLVFALASVAGAGEPAPPAEDTNEAAAEGQSQAPEQLGSPFEWFIVGSCLCVSFCAGGYTLISYLRRRDALSTLATLESRRRHRDDSSGFA